MCKTSKNSITFKKRKKLYFIHFRICRKNYATLFFSLLLIFLYKTKNCSLNAHSFNVNFTEIGACSHWELHKEIVAKYPLIRLIPIPTNSAIADGLHQGPYLHMHSPSIYKIFLSQVPISLTQRNIHPFIIPMRCWMDGIYRPSVGVADLWLFRKGTQTELNGEWERSSFSSSSSVRPMMD
jgi:hypothetical protein